VADGAVLAEKRCFVRFTVGDDVAFAGFFAVFASENSKNHKKKYYGKLQFHFIAPSIGLEALA
jgi:hypothetical protein